MICWTPKKCSFPLLLWGEFVILHDVPHAAHCIATSEWNVYSRFKSRNFFSLYLFFFRLNSVLLQFFLNQWCFFLSHMQPLVIFFNHFQKLMWFCFYQRHFFSCNPFKFCMIKGNMLINYTILLHLKWKLAIYTVYQGLRLILTAVYMNIVRKGYLQSILSNLSIHTWYQFYCKCDVIIPPSSAHMCHSASVSVFTPLYFISFIPLLFLQSSISPLAFPLFHLVNFLITVKSHWISSSLSLLHTVWISVSHAVFTPLSLFFNLFLLLQSLLDSLSPSFPLEK